MSTLFLSLCLVLTLACATARWWSAYKINTFRLELAALRGAKQKVVAQRQQLEGILEYVQIQERELVNDCRDLSGELSRIQSRTQQVEAMREHPEGREEGDVA